KTLVDKVSTSRIRWKTYLQFASHFGKAGLSQDALDALDRATPKGVIASQRGPELEATICHILRGVMQSPGGYHDVGEISSRILRRGVQFTTRNYNMIIWNACDAGDYATALRILNTMKQRGPEPNIYTYRILLHPRRADNRPVEVIQEGVNYAKAASSPEIASLVVQTSWQYMDNLSSSFGYHFTRLFNIYREFFDLRFLEKLEILNSGNELQKLMPSRTVLCLMLMVYIRSKRNRNPEHIWHLYTNLKHLTKAGDPVIAPMVESHHVWAMFLHEFIRHPETLNWCLTLLKDMLTPLPSSATHHTAQRPIRIPPPAPIIWQLLISAFMRHRQPEAARKVLDMMISRNVEPEDAHWDSMLRGYAKAQDLDRVAETLRIVERGGFRVSTETTGMLSRIRQKERLMTYL
ncbi:hypothetical protein M501DRAFT_922256, partial [Patellaria atrata CBS 101060]